MKKYFKIAGLLFSMIHVIMLSGCVSTQPLTTPIKNDISTSENADANTNGGFHYINYLSQGIVNEKSEILDEKGKPTGSILVKKNYYAATGVQCRIYYWIPSNTSKNELLPKLACQGESGWHKVRSFINEEFTL